jgi:hypothetical protein
MATKTLLSKETYRTLLKEFSAKVDSLSTAENSLNSDTAKKSFRETMEKNFLIVDEHGNVEPKERPMFTDPLYNPEPGCP